LNRHRLLDRLKQGHLQNVPFRDFVELVEGFGFRNVRQEGSHRAFARSQIQETLSLQPVQGEAKPYQIRQFLRLIEKYNLRLENES
jgi:predicted RNA binding protein YcfA (HicA-like mRNA interferase family)